MWKVTRHSDLVRPVKVKYCDDMLQHGHVENSRLFVDVATMKYLETSLTG